MRHALFVAMVVALVACDEAARSSGDDDAGRPPPPTSPGPTTPAPTPPPPSHDCSDRGGRCESGTLLLPECGPPIASSQCPSNPTRGASLYCCVPLDWSPLAVDPECGIEEAWHAGALPKPVAYEPCPAPLAEAWPSCFQIRVDWPAATGAFAGRSIGPTEAAIDPMGGVALALTRYAGAYAYHTLVNRAGSSVAAFRTTKPSCVLARAEVSGLFTFKRPGRTLLVVPGATPTSQVPRVPAKVLEDFSDDVVRSYVDGPGVYLTLPENVVKSRFNGGGVVATAPGGSKKNVLLFPNAMFFEPEDPQRPRVQVFKFPPSSTKDLLAGADTSAGVADFGSDRKDAVWVEGSGRPAVGAPFATIDVFTSAYVSDPALLGTSVQKRRLRSETSFGGAPFVVGCGYAAHAFTSPADGSGVRLIRLSDGTSWKFVDVPSGGADPIHFSRPLAISCNEIFFRVSRGVEDQVVRIGLSSLPPGSPAD